MATRLSFLISNDYSGGLLLGAAPPPQGHPSPQERGYEHGSNSPKLKHAQAMGTEDPAL